MIEKVFFCLGLLVALSASTLSDPCPTGYEEKVLGGKKRCYENTKSSRWSLAKTKDCFEMLKPQDLKGSDLGTGDYYWVQAFIPSAFGPVIDMNPKSERFGKPIFAESLWGEDREQNSPCVVYDNNNSTFVLKPCYDEHLFYCLADVYPEKMERGECKEDYYYVSSSRPVCMTKNNNFNGTHKQAMEFCRNKGGNLLNKGKLYANNRFLNKDYYFEHEIPVNPFGKLVSKSSYYFLNPNILKNKDDSKLFNQTICEHDVSGTDGELVFSPDTKNKKNINVHKTNKGSISDVYCFTDSETYYPTVPKVKKVDDSHIVIEREHNGQYWCVSDGNIYKYHEDQTDNELLWPKKKVTVMFVEPGPYEWAEGDEKLSLDDMQKKIEKYWDDAIKNLWLPGKAPSYVLRVAISDDDILILIEDPADNKSNRNPKSKVKVQEFEIETNTRTDNLWMFKMNFDEFF